MMNINKILKISFLIAFFCLQTLLNSLLASEALYTNQKSLLNDPEFLAYRHELHIMREHADEVKDIDNLEKLTKFLDFDFDVRSGKEARLWYFFGDLRHKLEVNPTPTSEKMRGLCIKKFDFEIEDTIDRALFYVALYSLLKRKELFFSKVKKEPIFYDLNPSIMKVLQDMNTLLDQDIGILDNFSLRWGQYGKLEVLTKIDDKLVVVTRVNEERIHNDLDKVHATVVYLFKNRHLLGYKFTVTR